MRGFWVGVMIGVSVGAGATYLGMARPWDGSETAEVALDSAPDEPAKQVDNKKMKKRRPRGKRSGEEDLRGSWGQSPQVVELSAADRKMVWKGQSVSLPARDLDFEGESGRSLGQGEIDSGVASARSRITGCIGSARGNAELSARITVKFLVDERGNATRSRVHAPAYLHQNGLEPCVRKAVRAMRFPATGAATVVTVPFDLS